MDRRDRAAVLPGPRVLLRGSRRGGVHGLLEPAGGRPGRPPRAPVEAGALSVPFLEDFELEGGEVSLFTLGWWTPSEAFDFYTWDVSGARANSGATSALHLRVPDDAGVVRDWLISPALDLSGQTEVMLRWSESGANTLAMGTHAIYLSTGSRDIAAGYIPLIESLDAPEGDWRT